MAVAETVRNLRTQSGISQENLADRIDSHQVYISEIENGKKIPSLSVLKKIADTFNMRLSQLVQQVESRLD